MKIGDLFDHDFDPNIARAVFKKYGVWPYPFSSVKRDPVEGYYIDWLNNPVDLPIEDINVGDKVADQSLNMTPYWVVDFVGPERIYLKPIAPNPFLTGVGAGGATLGEWDYEIFSGEAERKWVDNVLARIDQGLVASYSDIKYPLLGTAPLRFGPNGGEGGWYTPTDLWSNRGGKQGLTEEEIMVKDAATIQKLGLPVPPAALDGTMKVHIWGDLVSGTTIFRPREHLDILFPGEDWDDPTAMQAFILNHPLPDVKERNFEMLKELWNPKPHEGGLSLEEREAWWSGEYIDSEITPFVRLVLADLSEIKPGPQWQELDYDPNWKVKELAIQTAESLGWPDIVKLYEDSPDATNRRYVAYAYKALELPDDLLRMVQVEDNPETMRAIMEGLDSLGVDIVDIVSRDPERYQRLTTPREEEHTWNYYAEELRRYLQRRRRGESW